MNDAKDIGEWIFEEKFIKSERLSSVFIEFTSLCCFRDNQQRKAANGELELEWQPRLQVSGLPGQKKNSRPILANNMAKGTAIVFFFPVNFKYLGN